MPSFTIKKGQPAVEIAGVGLVDQDHQVPLERAAQRMPELQDVNGKPLTGQALVNSAKAWSDQVGNGLQVTGKPAKPAAKKAAATESSDSGPARPDPSTQSSSAPAEKE